MIEQLGQVLFHGIAMKPGKPTILGEIKGRPVMGLPGHPVAAFFVSQLFVRPMVAELLGQQLRRVPAQRRAGGACACQSWPGAVYRSAVEERSWSADGLSCPQ